MPLSIGSLFSGIGGLELGLERAGLGPVRWQVESDAFCRAVLQKHWPDVERFEDVRALDAAHLAPVDVLCGGFPCQPLSDAARGRNDGKTMWPSMRRIVERLRPRWIVVENVDGAAWRRWVPVVRRDLAERGYTSLPVRLRAGDVGAPYRGSRVFVAATYRESKSAGAFNGQVAKLSQFAGACRKDWGRPTPRALGVADGIPDYMDRNRSLGNAVVPQCAEVIGHMIRELQATTGPASR